MTKNRIISLLVLLGSLSLMIGGVVLILFATPIHDEVLPTLASFASPQADNAGALAAVPVSNRQAATLPPPAQTSVLPAQSQPAAVQPPSEAVPEQVVLTFAPDSSPADRAAYVAALGGEITEDMAALNTVVVNIPVAAVAFAPPPSPLLVESEPNYYVVAQHEAQANVVPNDPRLSEQWALPLIGAVESWHHLTADTPKVTVAVIDSGICEHPELMGRVLAGYDFIEDDNTPQDEFGHGCGVAGILAANSNDGIGMAGAAANVQIMPLRVLDRSGIGTYAQVAQAIVYAVDNGADIINISLGGTNESATLQNAVAYATERNVLLVAAAGNAGAESVLYPAAYADVIAVGSIDSNLRRSSFSNYGSGIGLWGPGRDILATNTSGGYSLFSGTSFAAPHVAAVAALEQALGGSLIVNGGIVAVGGQPQVSSTETPPAPTLTPGGPTPTPNAAAVNALFVETSAQGALSLEANLGVIRSRYTDINFSAISQTGAQGVSPQSALSEPVTLNLFDDVSLTTVFDTVEDHELTGNGFVWVGHIAGQPEDSETVLVVGDGQMAGYVRTLGKLYQIAYAGNGVHAINEISEQAFIDKHIHPIVPEGIETLDDPGVAPQTVSASGFAQIDLMVVYTALARTDLGGETATQNAIQLAVAAVNQAYVNSDVNARIRLVYSGYVNYTETYGDCGAGYPCNDAYNIGAMGPNASIGRTIANLRNDYQADVVTLISNNSPAYCGIAFQMAGAGQPNVNFEVYAFNVVWSQCLAGGRTLAHEIGHNMGAAHNFEDRALNIGLYSDSYGYWSPAGEIRTIMSYYNCPPTSSCVGISRFSSPYQTFGGVALGDANANNVRTLNITAPVVASFRSPNAVDVEPTATPALPTTTPHPDVTLPEATPLPDCTGNIIANGDVAGLISAINTANNNGSGTHDVICLAAGGLYEFSLSNPDLPNTGLPILFHPVTILGNGATIRRTGDTNLRFFRMQNATLNLHNLTLENGRHTSGGAIYVSGVLNLDQVTLIGNTSTGNGGAIYGASGAVAIRQSTLQNNMAYASGGAIYSANVAVVISHSEIVGNSAFYGGVIYLASSDTEPTTRPSLTIRYGNIIENSAELGAVLYNNSTASNRQVLQSCLTGNSPVAFYNTRTTHPINAVDNWWGSSLGPSLTTTVTPDRGDYVGEWVSYEPYQQAPYNFCPPRPVLTEPADNTLLNTDDVAVTWDIQAYEALYELEVATDPDFEFMVYSADVGSAENGVIPDLIDGTYYWRVQAYNDTNSEYTAVSNGRSFRVDTTPPAIPTLIDPVDDLVTADPQPEFTWNFNSDVALYELNLSGAGINEGFTTSDTSYTLDNLLLAGEYDWSVRAQDAAGNWSDWSAPYTFEVQSADDSAPVAPLFTTLTPTLSWGDITWAQGYHIQVAADAAFSQLIVDDNTLSGSDMSFTTPELLPGRYYWRVRVQNARGTWSKWSTDSFWVTDGDPLNP